MRNDSLCRGSQRSSPWPEHVLGGLDQSPVHNRYLAINEGTRGNSHISNIHVYGGEYSPSIKLSLPFSLLNAAAHLSEEQRPGPLG